MKYSELERRLKPHGCRWHENGSRHHPMIKIKAFIERGKDGTYGVYVDLNENRMNYGVIGDGHTVSEAIEDFYGCYEDMKKSFENDNQYFQEAEFEFHYDTASFQTIDEYIHDFENHISEVQFV